jgi:hypothetical protein
METPIPCCDGSVAEAVDLAGGAIAVAKACGKSRQAVDKWIRSDQLPRTEYTGETRYAELIAELAKARGKHLDPIALRANASPKKTAA